MNENSPAPAPPAGRAEPLGRLWGTSVAVAALGAWVMFDALPGINWLLWTGIAVAGLLLACRGRGRSPSATVLGGSAVVIAGAAAVTASEPLSALICFAVIFLLALQMLLAAGRPLRSVTAVATAVAPLVAIRIAALQSMRRAIEATDHIRSHRARAWVRGLAITLPILVVFALLLAGADPLFAAWRDAVRRLIESWAFVPRVAFFGLLLVIVLGAYSYASLAPESGSAAPTGPSDRWLGVTERLILLGGLAGLFWLFLALQLGYLFGTHPGTPASGMTFAEYARRGFGELTVVASASVLLIVLSERYGATDGREGALRLLTFAVIGAVLLLLGSAFRRVGLYEAAYGFTTARLYAQVYMAAVAAGLAVLAREVAGPFDAGRLFRRAAGAAMILFIGLIYWNHEAWIARRNLDRVPRTGELDIAYLTRELSPDAVPAMVERLSALPDSMRAGLESALRERYATSYVCRDRRWFEWNLARSRARRALEANAACTAG